MNFSILINAKNAIGVKNVFSKACGEGHFDKLNDLSMVELTRLNVLRS